MRFSMKCFAQPFFFKLVCITVLFNMYLLFVWLPPTSEVMSSYIYLQKNFKNGYNKKFNTLFYLTLCVG
jgi:hypothetical protein